MFISCIPCEEFNTISSTTLSTLNGQSSFLEVEGGDVDQALVRFLPLVLGLIDSDVDSNCFGKSFGRQFFSISSTIFSVKGIFFKADIIELGLSTDASHSFSHNEYRWSACGS